VAEHSSGRVSFLLAVLQRPVINKQQPASTDQGGAAKSSMDGPYAAAST
jgi:hypothetical protein